MHYLNAVISNEHSWMRAKSCFISVDQVPVPAANPAGVAALDESIDVSAAEPEPQPDES